MVQPRQPLLYYHCVPLSTALSPETLFQAIIAAATLPWLCDMHSCKLWPACCGMCIFLLLPLHLYQQHGSSASLAVALLSCYSHVILASAQALLLCASF